MKHAFNRRLESRTIHCGYFEQSELYLFKMMTDVCELRCDHYLTRTFYTAGLDFQMSEHTIAIAPRRGTVNETKGKKKN